MTPESCVSMKIIIIAECMVGYRMLLFINTILFLTYILAFKR